MGANLPRVAISPPDNPRPEERAETAIVARCLVELPQGVRGPDDRERRTRRVDPFALRAPISP